MENLITKSYWNNADIQAYLGCSRNTASKVHQDAIKKYKGLCPYDKYLVKRDSVLLALGLNPDAEKGLAIMSEIKNKLKELIE